MGPRTDLQAESKKEDDEEEDEVEERMGRCGVESFRTFERKKDCLLD